MFWKGACVLVSVKDKQWYQCLSTCRQIEFVLEWESLDMSYSRMCGREGGEMRERRWNDRKIKERKMRLEWQSISILKDRWSSASLFHLSLSCCQPFTMKKTRVMRVARAFLLHKSLHNMNKVLVKRCRISLWLMNGILWGRDNTKGRGRKYTRVSKGYISFDYFFGPFSLSLQIGHALRHLVLHSFDERLFRRTPSQRKILMMNG